MAILSDKVALIMGAGTRGNMGQVIAKLFFDQGAEVMVTGRDDGELAHFAAETGASHCVCDIRDEKQLEQLASRTKQQFGKLDIAVNAAGINLVKRFLDVTRADLQSIIDVQLIGTFLFMQTILREMSDGGSFIQISSVSASALLSDHAVYMATKAAADVLVRSAALDFGKRGIRVNSIAPGPTVDTPMAAPIMADESAVARIKSLIPLGRLGRAVDVAEAALWLARDTNFITGEVLQVNGGRAIPRL